MTAATPAPEPGSPGTPDGRTSSGPADAATPGQAASEAAWPAVAGRFQFGLTGRGNIAIKVDHHELGPFSLKSVREMAQTALRCADAAAAAIPRRGPLAVVPLRLAVRVPGVGGALPQPLAAGGTDAGRGWTVTADPPGSATWVPAYPPGGPDLGVLRCEAAARIDHPQHGTVEVPDGTWVLRETGRQQ